MATASTDAHPAHPAHPAHRGSAAWQRSVHFRAARQLANLCRMNGPSQHITRRALAAACVVGLATTGAATGCQKPADSAETEQTSGDERPAERQDTRDPRDVVPALPMAPP